MSHPLAKLEMTREIKPINKVKLFGDIIYLALALGMRPPRCSASSINSFHTSDCLSVSAEPRIHKAFFARVMLTFRRRTSFKNPTPVDEGLLLTALRIMTSNWRPWYESTVLTSTCTKVLFFVKIVPLSLYIFDLWRAGLQDSDKKVEGKDFLVSSHWARPSPASQNWNSSKLI